MTTLRTLECLVALVDTGSVTGAAAALRMSQPALSHQIASLERELGTPVVERLPRGVRVTAAGRAVAEDARVALEAADRAVRVGHRVGAGVGGRPRIACAETMTAWLLVPGTPAVEVAARPLRPRVRREVVAIIGAPSDALVRRSVADLVRRGLPSSARTAP
jgi:DNA-binding transcriptional LysR family regulator